MDTSEIVYTPSELLQEVRLHIEMGFPRVLVEAEISNLSRPASGHLYFSLKDKKAQIRCALFRSAAMRLNIRPENGMQVIARGRLSLYEARGDFQMIVDDLRDAGEGLLQRQFEALKKKLQAEGLFEETLKRPLPAYPEHIALITSPGGAAVRDMLQVLERRWPLARIRLYPTSVQGDLAPGEIIQALKAANQHGWADVVLMGRGGGSLEDLAAFNDEAVARCVAASKLPVVSAVGHETDFSICDFVADLRAPTPSAAAELASPDAQRIKRQFEQAGRQLASRMESQLQQKAQRLDHIGHRLQQQHPAQRSKAFLKHLESLDQRLKIAARSAMHNRQNQLQQRTLRLMAHHPGRTLERYRNRLETASARTKVLGGQLIRSRQERLQLLGRTLNAVSPLQVFDRGYAAISHPATGDIISRASELAPGDQVSAQMKDGSLDCTVDRIHLDPPSKAVT